MPTVFKRPEAEADLFLLWERVSLDSPDNADRVLDRLAESFDLLATQPLVGRARPELAPQLRSFVSGRYVIFYAPYRSGIDVIRVLDGRQDIQGEFER